MMSRNHRLLVVEETCTGSGIREALAWELEKHLDDLRADGLDLGRDFVPHGNQSKLYEYCAMDAPSIARKAKELLRG